MRARHTMRHGRRRLYAFLLAEVIAGAALTGMVISLYYRSVMMIRQVEKDLTVRTRAIMVLDNALERLRPLPERTLSDVREVLEYEFRSTPGAWPPGTRASCETAEGGVKLTVAADPGRPFAAVVLPWQD